MNTTKVLATQTPIPKTGTKFTNNSNQTIWYSVSTDGTLQDGKHPLMPYKGIDVGVEFADGDKIFFWTEFGTAEIGATE